MLYLHCWTFFERCCSLLHNAPLSNWFEPCQKKPHRYIFLAACPAPLPLLPRPETVPRCFFSAHQTHPDKEQARLELRLLSAWFGWRGLGRKIKGFSVLSALCRSAEKSLWHWLHQSRLLFQRSKTRQSLKMTKMVIAVVKNKPSNYAFFTFMYTLRLSHRS